MEHLGEPEYQLYPATKKVLAMASVISRLKQSSSDAIQDNPSDAISIGQAVGGAARWFKRTVG